MNIINVASYSLFGTQINNEFHKDDARVTDEDLVKAKRLRRIQGSILANKNEMRVTTVRQCSR